MAAGEYTTLALVTADLTQEGTTWDTTYDTQIQKKVDAANARVTEYIGLYIGPSSDTVRTYDVPLTVTPDGFRRLFIPGGIRTATLLEVATQTGGTFSTVASTDYFLRPLATSLPTGAAFTEIWMSNLPVGSVSGFSGGYGVVRITGTFGPAAVPSSLVEIATTLAKRMWMSRQSGEGDVVGTSAFGNAIYSRFLSLDDKRTLDWWRYEVTTFGGI